MDAAVRIRIDLDRCQGHGQCEGVAPGVFAVGEDSRAHLLVEHGDVPADQVGAVDDAVAMCPEAALAWEPLNP